jgi:hypothetical protein
VPLDSEGEWNWPLLENAAAMSGADCIFASSGPTGEGLHPGIRPLEDVLAGFRHVIACEAVRGSISVYDFPAPREKTAVIVGNEERGIPRWVLKKADTIVSVPMAGTGMSSVNVAVSAATALYAFSADFGRKKPRRSGLFQRDEDVLINAPADPHELGSLLRSVWAFGWRRVFLDDPHGVWFTPDHKTVLDSRAAARRHKNPLTVLAAEQIRYAEYDVVLRCNSDRHGSRLSRLSIPDGPRLLIVLGDGPMGDAMGERNIDCYVDIARPDVLGRFRHTGSIILSMVSQMVNHG